MEDFDPDEFERQLALGSTSSSSSESDSSDSEAKGSSKESYRLRFFNIHSDNSEYGAVLTEDEIVRGRSMRYGRRRSQSIDYGNRGSGSHEFEQTPEQALVSRSLQLLRTIPRFQYEAPSWVPNLLCVQDTQAEINAEVIITLELLQ